jgi:hypothetical protein
MQHDMLRPRVTRLYTALMGLATPEVILQGFLFSGFYSRGNKTWIDVHGIAGELTGYVVR